MFENGQKVMLKTYEELAEQFGGWWRGWFIWHNDRSTYTCWNGHLSRHKGNYQRESKNYDAYLIEEDEEGWAFPSVAFVNEE